MCADGSSSHSGEGRRCMAKLTPRQERLIDGIYPMGIKYDIEMDLVEVYAYTPDYSRVIRVRGGSEQEAIANARHCIREGCFERE